MPKTDNVRQVDLPRGTSGGSVYIRGGGVGGVSNADTVDGYHAASIATAGKLLALDASAQFNPSVIEWADVAGAGLGASGDTLVVQYGASATTIAPDDAAAAGSAANASRSDHRHGIAAAAPANNLTVTSANAEGDATSFARSNHTHAITTSANPGAAASILASSSDGYLQLVRLGLGVAPSVALQAQGTTPQLRIQSDASHYATFGADGSGNLTILPSGNSVLLDGDKTLSSDDWASQTTGWGIYPESTHGRSGYADFRYIYSDELHVKAFIADLEQALAGGQIISKSVAIIAADFTVPAKGSTATLRVQDLPGTTAAVFASGDWIRIRNISRSGGGLVVADCYGTVGSATLNGDGTQSYTFTRPAGDTGSAAQGTVVLKGGLALDYGVSGNGYWEVTTLDTAGSPYAQVATWATHPQTVTVRTRLGNLDGIAGIGAEWGLWAGKDSNHWIKVSDAGAEIKGLKQTWIDAGGNTRGMVDPSAGAGDYLFWLGPSSGNKRFGVTGDGTVYIGNVPSQNVAGWAYSGDLTKIDGGNIQANTVTAAQMAVVNANLVSDWSFEYGGRGWTLNTGASLSATGARTGASQLVGDGNRPSGYTYAEQTVPVQAGAVYYAEVWCYVSSGARDTGGTINWLDAAGASISYSDFHGATTGPRTRHSVLAMAPSNAAFARIVLSQWGTANAAAPRWDDVVFRAASGMNLVVGTPGSARVEVNNAGIEGYDSSGDKQFYIRTSDGRAMFGGGHGVLDSSGLVLSGNDTSYQTYDAVRWLTVTDPPGGLEVARIAAGRWAGLSNYYEMTVETNPALVAGYPSDILLRANTKAWSGSGGNYIRGGLSLRGQIVQASAILYTEVDEGEGNAAIHVIGTADDSYIKFMTADTERMRIDHSGNVAVTVNGTLVFAAGEGGATIGGGLVLGSGGTLTIASGAITVTHANHIVDTEGGAATDDLDTIYGGVTGDILILHSATFTRVVTLKDGTGNLRLAGDFTLGDTSDSIMLMYWNNAWNEISRSNN